MHGDKIALFIQLTCILTELSLQGDLKKILTITQRDQVLCEFLLWNWSQEHSTKNICLGHHVKKVYVLGVFFSSNSRSHVGLIQFLFITPKNRGSGKIRGTWPPKAFFLHLKTLKYAPKYHHNSWKLAFSTKVYFKIWISFKVISRVKPWLQIHLYVDFTGHVTGNRKIGLH
jgi:hypothetical protein